MASEVVSFLIFNNDYLIINIFKSLIIHYLILIMIVEIVGQLLSKLMC